MDTDKSTDTRPTGELQSSGFFSKKSAFRKEVRSWTASNGRYLEVVVGATKSITVGGIKAWSQLVVTVLPF